jgi:2-hydroxychromene-2-carboxylate isomerase
MSDVAFYFDFGSPNAFLCHRVIPAIEARTGTSFAYVPILLGGLFKLTGNQSPVMAFANIKNKLAYDQLEMQRFVARHQINDFRFNPHFPINTLQLMRGAVAAQELGVFKAYIDRIYDDVWTRGLDMGSSEIVAASLNDAGLPVAAIFERAQAPEIKQRLLDNTHTAFENGAFGSPTFLVGSALYFGKDRLRDVEDAILSDDIRAEKNA